jgi:RND family efflux transporter MFP subunit
VEKALWEIDGRRFFRDIYDKKEFFMKSARRLFQLCLFLFFVTGLPSWAQGPPPPPVAVSAVVQKNIRESVVLVGTATSRVTSLLASEAEGLVEKLYVEEGAAVKKGQVLARLRSSTLKIQLTLARAARKEAQERYLQAKAELERSEKLRRSQSISEKKFLDDRFETMAWEQRVIQREAEVSRLRDLLSKKTIVSPFSGFVARKHTEVGQWVERGGGIVTLIDLSYIHVVAQVPERYIDRVLMGDQASVTIDALGSKTFLGKIISVNPEGDREARTFPVKVQVKNEGFQIKSGMLSHVSFSLGKSYPAILVSKDALVTRDNQKFVFVYQNDTVKMVRLNVKGYHGGMAEVSGNLKAGFLVVTRGNERLRDGQKVRIIREPGRRQ